MSTTERPCMRPRSGVSQGALDPATRGARQQLGNPPTWRCSQAESRRWAPPGGQSCSRSSTSPWPDRPAPRPEGQGWWLEQGPAPSLLRLVLVAVPPSRRLFFLWSLALSQAQCRARATVFPTPATSPGPSQVDISSLEASGQPTLPPPWTSKPQGPHTPLPLSSLTSQAPGADQLGQEAHGPWPWVLDGCGSDGDKPPGRPGWSSMEAQGDHRWAACPPRLALAPARLQLPVVPSAVGGLGALPAGGSLWANPGLLTNVGSEEEGPSSWGGS